jgi:RND superfamily putative drug exporter
MQTLARWSFTHRRVVLALWLLAAVLATLGSRLIGPHYSDDLKLPGTGSAAAADLLHRGAPHAGDVDQIVFATDTGRITDPNVAREVRGALTRIAALPHVSAVASPYGHPLQISRDGSIAFANVTFDRDGRLVPTSATRAVLDTARSISDQRLHVAMNGWRSRS